MRAGQRDSFGGAVFSSCCFALSCRLRGCGALLGSCYGSTCGQLAFVDDSGALSGALRFGAGCTRRHSPNVSAWLCCRQLSRLLLSYDCVGIKVVRSDFKLRHCVYRENYNHKCKQPPPLYRSRPVYQVRHDPPPVCIAPCGPDCPALRPRSSIGKHKEPRIYMRKAVKKLTRERGKFSGGCNRSAGSTAIRRKTDRWSANPGPAA